MRSVVAATSLFASSSGAQAPHASICRRFVVVQRELHFNTIGKRALRVYAANLRRADFRHVQGVRPNGAAGF